MGIISNIIYFSSVQLLFLQHSLSPCEFQCRNEHCIPLSHVCDGILDCPNGDDVRNCSTQLRNVQYFTIADYCSEDCDNTMCYALSCSTDFEAEPKSLCPAIQRQRAMNATMFQPSCERDKSFSEVQCDGKYCWCVDVVSGQPFSEGQAERPECIRCRTPSGNEIRVGRSYTLEDGCNKCVCSSTGKSVCSLKACDTAPCLFKNREVMSGINISDECNTCHCFAGSLTCTKRNVELCMEKAPAISVTWIMPFDGNFDEIMRKLEEFKRAVIETFLSRYSASLGLRQDQIQEVEVFESSVVIVVTDTEGSGANTTILSGQVQQDYEKGILFIRFGTQVLLPSGEFESNLNGSPVEFGLTSSWIALVVILAIVPGITITITTLILTTHFDIPMTSFRGDYREHKENNHAN